MRAYVAGIAAAYARAGLADEGSADLDAAVRAVEAQLAAAGPQPAPAVRAC
jgi:hypothetical protein